MSDLSKRGAIRNREQIARLRDFTGLRWGKITPTDIDGWLEFGDKIHVFWEAKTTGSQLPYGQGLALERIADDLGKAKPTLLLVVGVPPNTPEPVDYAPLIVSASREHGEWGNEYKGMTLRSAIDKFREQNDLH